MKLNAIRILTILSAFHLVFPVGTANVVRADPNNRGADAASARQTAGDFFQVECPSSKIAPTFSLKAAAINGTRIAPSNSVRLMPGDQIDAEIYLLCWGPELPVVATYQASILIQLGAASGAGGLITPLGWDAPHIVDYCPCDAAFPICDSTYGCIGSDHQPWLGAFADISRPDFVLAGLNVFHGVSLATLTAYRFGATVDADLNHGAVDGGVAGYGGSLRLMSSPDTCGVFTFQFEDCISNQNFLCDGQEVPNCLCPDFEPLTLHVCEDDGLYCNGRESCNEHSGCQITPPPSCDDGVACTVDSCDEAADGCDHALNHDACDDGNGCTRDECTPTGCVHADDQCGNIPAASSWGLAVLALCLLIAAKGRFSAGRREC